MHCVYLPFEEHQLRGHFMEVKGDPTTDPERHLAYYRKSIERWRAHQGLPAPAPREVKRARQIEKDERFCVVAALMALFHSADPRAAFSALLDRSKLHAPGPHGTWKHALNGRLHLWFEVVLGSPLAYREHLKSRLDERTPIPYVREAAAKARLRLEGATHVDALVSTKTTTFLFCSRQRCSPTARPPSRMTSWATNWHETSTSCLTDRTTCLHRSASAIPPSAASCDEAIRAWGHDHAGTRRRATQSALASCRTAGTSQTTASGGSVTSAEASCPCHGIGSASMPLGSPTLEPP